MFRAIINGADSFDLITWNPGDFRNDLTLVIMGMDIAGVKQACENIQKVEIYNNNTLTATYTQFDSFDNIMYINQIFVPELNIFTDALQITLTKANIVDIVQRLDEQINPTVDIEAMDVDEYRAYKLKEISKACTASIYEGDQVVLSDGHVETFSFDDKDQADLQALSSIAMLNPDIELTWHSNGNLCRFYSGVDIILIYQTLNMKLFRETTICNAINLLVRNAQSKDEIAEYYWGCVLPEDEQNRVNELIAKMSAIVNGIISQLIPVQEQESTEPTESTAEEPNEQGEQESIEPEIPDETADETNE